jgi:hypothetical protein
MPIKKPIKAPIGTIGNQNTPPASHPIKPDTNPIKAPASKPRKPSRQFGRGNGLGSGGTMNMFVLRSQAR